jgi:hypothetical protein
MGFKSLLSKLRLQLSTVTGQLSTAITPQKLSMQGLEGQKFTIKHQNIAASAEIAIESQATTELDRV